MLDPTVRRLENLHRLWSQQEQEQAPAKLKGSLRHYPRLIRS